MTLKEKLTAVSYGGFDVENIEVVTAQLRELIHALYAEDYHRAAATASAIEARTYSLRGQVQRKLERESLQSA
jgi:hypothetical protein